jgi:D-3-phosphoglycerate dehydrogenase
MKALISTSSFAEYSNESLNLLKSNNIQFITNPYKRKLTDIETIDLAKDVDYIIAGVENYNIEVLNMLTNLKCISRVGVGFDSINKEELERRNIPLFLTTNSATEAVAELSIALCFNMLRNISISDRDMKSGKWIKHTGYLLSGKTVGIIGLGRIGKNTALKYKNLGCKIFAFDVYPDTNWSKLNNINLVELDKLLSYSDIISIHVPGVPNGGSLINIKELNLLKKECFVINLSRGGVVNEKDLFNFLVLNQNIQFALDVFENEPYSGDLINFKNITFTPHIGTYTKESKNLMEMEAVKNLINYINS